MFKSFNLVFSTFNFLTKKWSKAHELLFSILYDHNMNLCPVSLPLSSFRLVLVDPFLHNGLFALNCNRSE